MDRCPGKRCATPATLKAQTAMRSVMARPTENDPLVLHRQSTATRRAVARELAAAHGVTEFDDEHFVCIGSGRPVGTPVVHRLPTGQHDASAVPNVVESAFVGPSLEPVEAVAAVLSGPCPPSGVVLPRPPVRPLR